MTRTATLAARVRPVVLTALALVLVAWSAAVPVYRHTCAMMPDCDGMEECAMPVEVEEPDCCAMDTESAATDTEATDARSANAHEFLLPASCCSTVEVDAPPNTDFQVVHPFVPSGSAGHTSVVLDATPLQPAMPFVPTPGRSSPPGPPGPLDPRNNTTILRI